MTPSNFYVLDLRRLATWLTPKTRRGPVVLILVRAVVMAIYATYNALLRYRSTKLYQLSVTTQVCYLQRMLNDRYDSTPRRIRIVDAVWHLPSFLYQDSELKPLPVYQESEAHPAYVRLEGEVGAALLDFVVEAPTGLAFNRPEMVALLNQYKLFGTNYTIQLV